MKKAAIPPLGPKPRFVWIEERVSELKKCIIKFLCANYPIPSHITEEYNILIEEATQNPLEKEMRNTTKNADF